MERPLTPEEAEMIAWLMSAKDDEILGAMRETEKEIFREGEEPCSTTTT